MPTISPTTPIVLLPANASNGNQRVSFIAVDRRQFNVAASNTLFTLTEGLWRMMICQSISAFGAVADVTATINVIIQSPAAGNNLLTHFLQSLTPMFKNIYFDLSIDPQQPISIVHNSGGGALTGTAFSDLTVSAMRLL
jgi:hypothetical protein